LNMPLVYHTSRECQGLLNPKKLVVAFRTMDIPGRHVGLRISVNKSFGFHRVACDRTAAVLAFAIQIDLLISDFEYSHGSPLVSLNMLLVYHTSMKCQELLG